jgi:hypothetical protein
MIARRISKRSADIGYYTRLSSVVRTSIKQKGNGKRTEAQTSAAVEQNDQMNGSQVCYSPFQDLHPRKNCCNFVPKIKSTYHLSPMVPKTKHRPASNRVDTCCSKSVKGFARTYDSDCSREGSSRRFALKQPGTKSGKDCLAWHVYTSHVRSRAVY